MTNRELQSKYFDIAFSLRPEFELYELKSDPDQINNVAADPDYAEVLRKLTNRMMTELRETGDPRIVRDGARSIESHLSIQPSFHPRRRRRS